MLNYRYDPQAVEIAESRTGEDYEFELRLLDPQRYASRLQAVQRGFEANEVYTDVLFYPYGDHRYRVIVRPDYYNEFIAQMLRYRMLLSASWEDRDPGES